MFQGIHSNAPLPIHFKGGDGDLVLKIPSGWALSKQCKEILPVSCKAQMPRQLATG